MARAKYYIKKQVEGREGKSNAGKEICHGTQPS